MTLSNPAGAQRAVARVPDDVGPALYRGWMTSSASYAALAPCHRECTSMAFVMYPGRWPAPDGAGAQIS
jgi:hypothetical protein